MFIINRFQCYIRIPCKILVWIQFSIIIKKYFKMCLWVLKYCNVSLDNTTKSYSSGLGFLESYRALVHKKIIRCAPLFFMTPGKFNRKIMWIMCSVLFVGEEAHFYCKKLIEFSIRRGNKWLQNIPKILQNRGGCRTIFNALSRVNTIPIANYK